MRQLKDNIMLANQTIDVVNVSLGGRFYILSCSVTIPNSNRIDFNDSKWSMVTVQLLNSVECRISIISLCLRFNRFFLMMVNLNLYA